MLEVYVIVAISAAFVLTVAGYVVAAVVSDASDAIAYFKAKNAASNFDADEIVTPIKTVAIPEGMSFEEFEAWLETAFDETT